MFEALPIFLLTDQPTTCPYCGARCEVIASFMHTLAKQNIMRCLNNSHPFIFIEEDTYLTRQF